MGKSGQPALNRTCIQFISGYRTLLLVCLFFFGPGLLRAETGMTVPQQVLLLNSYHKELAWTDGITRDIMDTFAGQALDILKGTLVDKIRVQGNTPGKLPSVAEIETQAVSVFQKYRELIFNGGLGLILAGVIYILIRVRRSERRMEKSLFLHKSLFEKTNDAILILDATTGRCLDANPAARDITGRPLSELKNMTIRELSPQSEEKWMASERPGTRAVDLGQVTYVAKDGSQRFARASSVSLGDNVVMAIAKDITQDLELEKQLRQAQKMEAIGTLAGGIAHDFNNILSGIYSYSQLAQMNLGGNPEKAMAHIEQVIKGAKRASELVHQILTFSRQAEPRPSYFELSLIVKEAVKFLRSSIPSSIEIREDIISSAGIQADPTQVHQVVMNLGTNAYHAMGETGGVMTVILEDVELSQSDIPSHYRGAVSGAYVRMVVEDTGHGMDADTLARIFDPYFTTKKPGKGTGMGLSVVDGIIRQHGGFIHAESTPGQGARFEVCWPASEYEVLEAVPNEQEEDTPAGQGNILAVDDEPGILNALKALLGRRGYSVTITNSPVAALEWIEKDPDAFDLLITDMTMPKMSGIQLAEKIQAVRGDLPMILCTGYHESVAEPEALAHGFGRFLEKPVMTGELYKAVSDLMNPPSPKGS